MNIPDNIVKQKLKNVYFIWGTGKTTTANELHKRHGFYVYHTDYSRQTHFQNAEPEYQPAMCRDILKEYGIKDYLGLPPKVAGEWEREIVREFTPMIIADLIGLASQHEVVICEGDIDEDTVITVSTNIVVLSNHGKKHDWFDRPDQRHMLENIRNRTDLTEQEKDELIKNAYAIVGGNSDEKNNHIHEIPRVVTQYGIRHIIFDDSTTIPGTVALVEEYFGFHKRGESQ